MKMRLNLRLGILLLLLTTGFHLTGLASHLQGGDLTYQAVAPYTFTVTLKLYRDCSAASVPANTSLKIISPNCNTGRTIPMTKVGGNLIGNPYCPTSGIPVCSTTGSPNYEEAKYTTTITFSVTERTCSDWYLSWAECCRPSVANVTNAAGNSLYVEAYLKLGLPIPNSSPEFSPLSVPMPLVCYNQPNFYSFNAAELDGDSLLYELVSPLDSYNTPVMYGPNLQSGSSNQIIVNPNSLPPYNQFQPQLAQLTGPVPPTYNPAYPMPSVYINWGGPATIPFAGAPFTGKIWAATPEFKLNPATGLLQFIPTRYVPNNLSANKYVVTAQISEFRKSNGSWIKVGHIRRDVVFLVQDCGNNAGPNFTMQPISNYPYIICGFDTLNKIPTCNTSRLRFNFNDPDGDKIHVMFDQNQVNKLPNGRIQVIGQGQANVTVEIDITPGLADQGKKYQIGLRIEDDGCPIKHSRIEVISLEVERKNQVKIIGNPNRIICLGEESPIQISFKGPDSLLFQPASYSYTWSLADPSQSGTAGLNPADIHNKDITVNPLQTGVYKYLLRVVPVSTNPAFAGCADTTSVIIRVEEKPNPAQITLTDPVTHAAISEIRQGSSGQLDVLMQNPANTYTYSWSPGKFLNDSTLKNPIANPLTTTTFTVKVKNIESNCESELSREIQVIPVGLPNIITPNNDGKNDTFKVPGMPANTSLRIYNSMGRMLKEYPNYQNNFSGEGLNNGTYFYLLQEPGGATFKGWLEIIR